MLKYFTVKNIHRKKKINETSQLNTYKANSIKRTKKTQDNN